uniref:Kinesin-like protein KIF2A-like N-terminal domain-containing protein n=1 Tax=Anopheles culicifacies TaxID=139723 RepID=A0A182MD39_9DIPT
MLWFKKRLSTLFGGGKRSAKREEQAKGPVTEESASASASTTAATGCNSKHATASSSSSGTAAPAAKHPKPSSIRQKQKKHGEDSTLPSCDQCASGKQCRVHTAIVSRFHEATRSVTVEWYERGESKGKEIEIDMLLELNKNLQHQPQQHQLEPLAETSSELQREALAPANLSRVGPEKESDLKGT